MFWLLINELLFRPILNLLFILVVLFGWSMWWSIVALTLIIRLMLYKVSDPMAIQQQMWEWQADMTKKMQEIQEKYASNPEKQSKEMMELMKKWWLSGPLKWCKMILFQIPIFIWLYTVINGFATYNNPTQDGLFHFTFFFSNITTIPSEAVYSFLHNFINHFVDIQNFALSNLQTVFFGIDLLKWWNLALSIIVWVIMIANMSLMTRVKPVQMPSMWSMGNMANMPDMSKMMWSMNYIMAIMMAGMVYGIASGVGIYMLTTTVFGVVQFVISNRVLIKVKINSILKKWQWVIIEKK